MHEFCVRTRNRMTYEAYCSEAFVVANENLITQKKIFFLLSM